MSRSGYSDDCDGWDLIRWRGAVKSAIKGKRGQAALRELLDALDSLPEKSLVAESLVNEDGEYCTLGALGRARGLDLAPIDPEDREAVAQAFGISEAMAAEIMWINDEHVSDRKFVDVEICGPVRPYYPEFGRHIKSVNVWDESSGYKRWKYMRDWVDSQIVRAAQFVVQMPPASRSLTTMARANGSG